MFLVMAVGVIVIWTFHEGGGEVLKEDKYFVFDTEDFILIVEAVQFNAVFEGKLGGETLKKEEKDTCESPDDKYCYQLDKGPSLHLSMVWKNNVQCYTVSWENISSEYIPKDCYTLKSGSWYGMLSTITPSDMFWPISNVNVLTRILHPGYNSFFGNVYDYYWLTTEGTSFYILDNSPILFSMHNHEGNRQICISPSLLTHVGEKTFMKYAVCQGPNIKDVHIGTSQQFRTSSQTYSSNKTLTSTSQLLFSASSEYDSASAALQDLGEMMNKKGFTYSALEVPENWEEEFGDHLAANSSLLSVVTSLSQAGYKLVYPFSPFCSYKSRNFMPSMEKDEFVKNSLSNAVQLFKYANSQVALWDVSNLNIKGNFFNNLSNFVKDYEVFSFQMKPLPSIEIDNSELLGDAVTSEMYSNWIDVLYQVTSNTLGPLINSTFRSHEQQSIVEVTFQKLNSSGSYCLSNSIPNALTLGLYGYPLLMSSLDPSDTLDTGDEELVIRWLQISIFFPWIKIPYSFFNFNIYTQTILNLRSSIFTTLDEEKVLESLSVSAPYLRPLWWLSPTDQGTYTINDHFMVADRYLVAPVLCNGTRSKDVYLPKGDHSWMYKGQEYKSGWHKNFPVPLDEILVFEKRSLQQNAEL
ncbi:hypothetical protein FSP39_000483 [Pinctada imbricata]|uniref:Glycosyl hydrolase family 31 C-terminal domain-containing protein n=1 Tax=Pinctada imbricata TaxID=66713 RepID=A0AA89C685_PINIB|nr:hypothetical protein FSP39_000483 [Pinctada imbricata]